MAFLPLVKAGCRLIPAFRNYGEVVEVFLKFFIFLNRKNHRDFLPLIVNDIPFACVHICTP